MLKYLSGEGEQYKNTYAKYGSFMHKILEMMAKKELDKDSAIVYYLMNYSDDVGEFFYVSEESQEQYHKQGLEYLKSLEFDWERYEILGVELKVNFKIVDKYEFVGYIDLLLRDRETGEIIIVDHKSADLMFRQDGKPYKKDEQHFEDFKTQLYLYSYWVKQKYGRVDKLAWNLFKQNNIVSVDWEEIGMKNALAWALKTIWMIEDNDSLGCGWDKHDSFFYCNRLCSMKPACRNMED